MGLGACPGSEPGRLTGAGRRAAASSVAPICLHIGAPCVLASHHLSRVIHRGHFPDSPLGLLSPPGPPGVPVVDGPPGAPGGTLPAVLPAADSTVTWIVGYALAALLLGSSVVPYLLARSYGFPVGGAAAAVWALAGALLGLTLGDLGAAESVGLALAFCGAPWLLGALLGGRRRDPPLRR